MHTKTTLSGSSSWAAFRPGPVGGHTRQGIRWIVLSGLVIFVAAGTGGLTGGGEREWIVAIVAALTVWIGWLYLRTAEGDCDVPVHPLQPLLALPIVILLAHLVKGGAAAGEAGFVISGDTSTLIRLMMLALVLLLVQDVLSRVRHLRWLLTALGATMALGAVLRVAVGQDAPPALVLTGLAGVGVLLSPSLVPSFARPIHPVFARKWFIDAAVISRISLGALLAIALAVLRPETTALACAVVGCAMLLAGGFLRHHRLALLGGGAMLALGGAVAMARLGIYAGDWPGGFALLGRGRAAAAATGADATGLQLLGETTGWVGLIAICAGMLAALAWCLYANRNSAPGDQARAALWSCVAALSGTALLAGGGMGIPAVALAVALTFGLTPHLMAHRVASLRGWGVAVAFAAILVALGLERRYGGHMWRRLAAVHGAGTMHFFGAMVLTVVLFWQTRSRKLSQAALCCIAGAAIASAGELLQAGLTTSRASQWSDVVANALGAALALAIFAAIHAAGWIEAAWAQRPTDPSLDKYGQPWQAR